MTKDASICRIFGSNLKRFRNEKGLSQRTLFYICGIDNGTLSRMENGQINVTLNTLAILAEALGVPWSAFLLNANEEPDSKVTNTLIENSDQAHVMP